MFGGFLHDLEIMNVSIIYEKQENRLYRIVCPDTSYVLKVSADNCPVEPQAYALLSEYGVPTLKIYRSDANSILMEDLDTSDLWRKAVASDLSSAEAGEAIAKWYLTLHAVGSSILSDPGSAIFKWEMDSLNPQVILNTGRSLNLIMNPVWQFAADNIDMIKAAVRKLSRTITYNDFFWTNLALSRISREIVSPVQAVVYDYHLMGVGLRYSDCDNVSGSLQGDARDAFWGVYGSVDDLERVYHNSLADLYALSVAVQRENMPVWAMESIRAVESGEVERHLREAVNFG